MAVEAAPVLGAANGDAKPHAIITSWVACDGCNKWRRIPKAVAEALQADAGWKCANNPDPAFASCAVAQELTDEQIDREGSSDDEGDSIEKERRRRKKRPAVWQLVADNIYTHRKRKVQDEDDIMICQCREPTYGGEGCGANCLNQLLNIECVPGYCPSGEHCHNQMFSRRQGAHIEKRRAGAKGFGLFTAEDISAGQFIIQYVGEVLEEEEYMRRKIYYQNTGQRHYYFMNIGNGEVIDACRKGALGRFINHSCEPNCETQKWLVQGELAIGLFAQKDVKAGEELTFDYNFERYGDKPMRCLCASAQCRGFIGGTAELAAASTVYQDAEDATEDPEPIMVTEKEQDDVISAILDKHIGVGCIGWGRAMEQRLEQLAVQNGVALWEGSDDGSSSDDGDSAKLEQGRLTVVEAAARPDSRGRLVRKRHSSALKAASIPSLPRKRLTRRPSPPAVAAATKVAVNGATSHEPPSSGNGAYCTPFSGNLAALAPSTASASALTSAPQALKSLEATSAPVPPTSYQPASRKPTKDVLSSMVRAWERERALPEGKRARRRSEIDRRLESLVPAGLLRASNPTVIIKILRLFNLCDIGPMTQHSEGGTAAHAHGRPHSAPFRSPERSRPSSSHENPPSQSATPVLRAAPAESLHPAGLSRPATPDSQESGELPGRAADVVSKPEAGYIEAGLLGPPPPLLLPPPPVQRGGEKGHGQERSAGGGRTLARSQHRRSSGSRDSEVESARPSQAAQELTPRQRARMADLSLLLDVVLKSQSTSVRREFVRCGLLRQLQSTIGRNVSPHYHVVLKKMLKTVELLPLSADDLHLTRSAHGTFADVLQRLTQHSEHEVRTKAMVLLVKYPMSACTRPVLHAGASQPAGAEGLGFKPSGAASFSAEPQSSAASSTSHYHYQGPQCCEGANIKTLGRGTPPTRLLSRFAEVPGLLSNGRGGGGLNRSLSASRLGNGGPWENSGGGGSGGGGLPPYGSGDPRVRLSPHPATPVLQSSPARSQYPEATPPHQLHGGPVATGGQFLSPYMCRLSGGPPPPPPPPPVSLPPPPPPPPRPQVSSPSTVAKYSHLPVPLVLAPPWSAAPWQPSNTIGNGELARRAAEQLRTHGLAAAPSAAQADARWLGATVGGDLKRKREDAAAEPESDDDLPPGFGGTPSTAQQPSEAAPVQPPAAVWTSPLDFQQPTFGLSPGYPGEAARSAAAGSAPNASSGQWQGGYPSELASVVAASYHGDFAPPPLPPAAIPASDGAFKPAFRVGSDSPTLPHHLSGAAPPPARHPPPPPPPAPRRPTESNGAYALSSGASPSGNPVLKTLLQPDPPGNGYPPNSAAVHANGLVSPAAAAKFLEVELPSGFFADAPSSPAAEQKATAFSKPGDAFKAFVAEVVRRRVGKYMVPEHPIQLAHAEAQHVHYKAVREVIGKEQQAFMQRQRANVQKDIDRRKVEHSIKEFVRATVRRLRDKVAAC